MEVQTPSCNGCAAALDVGPATNFVTCAHCGSRFAVKRAPSRAYAGVLQRVEGHTAQMAGDVEVVRLKSELELLDVDRDPPIAWRATREAGNPGR
jgi:hypothetical protein